MLIQETVQKFLSLTKSRSTPSPDTVKPDETDAPVNDLNQNNQSPAKRVAAENPEGSPKKKPKTVSIEKDDASKEECDCIEKSENARYCCRRDSLLGDAQKMERVAKITQMFAAPPKTAPRNISQGNSHAFVRQVSIHDVENEQTHLCPKVEGRIVRADEKVFVF